MIIHRDMARINRYKKRLEETIGQLEHTVAENEELIAARKRIMLTVTHDCAHRLRQSTAMRNCSQRRKRYPNGRNTTGRYAGWRDTWRPC